MSKQSFRTMPCLVAGLMLALTSLGMLFLVAPRDRFSAPKPQLAATFAHLPLSFAPNRGQADGQVKFLARGRGYTLALAPDRAALSLKRPTAGPARLGPKTATAYGNLLTASPSTAGDPQQAPNVHLSMHVVGASSTAQMAGIEELPGKNNYFIGNDPKKWATNVPTYAKAQTNGIYPGVDMVYYGQQGQLEYDFRVAPGADPSSISLAFEGELEREGKVKPNLGIDSSGDLVIALQGSEVRFHKPLAYQPDASPSVMAAGFGTSDAERRTPVDAQFVLRADNRVGFELADYDHSRPLVIDPTLAYSTYLGGSDDDQGMGIAVDSTGIYVAGTTTSPDFPTMDAYQPQYAYGSGDCFITKFTPDGSALIYSTYLGGNGVDVAEHIVVDSTGEAYVTGYTSSTDFPVMNAFQPKFGGPPHDAFVTKFNSSGSALVYSTYLGGSGDDFGYMIAIDSSGSAYVTGETNSKNFPLANAFQPTYGGDDDAFVTKLSPSGEALVYSTYLGGSGTDIGFAITVDKNGSAYVAGQTRSTNFPTQNPFQATFGGGGGDAFVTKFSPAGTALVYSTFLGGNYIDSAADIAVDKYGYAYVSGGTASTNFPTKNPFQAKNHGQYDAFLSKLSIDGTTLLYSTYIGGSQSEFADAITLDSSANIYLAGYTISANFPTKNPIQAELNDGSWDIFLVKFNFSATTMYYSTYLGGSALDWADSVAVDSSGNAYLTGGTASTDFPTKDPFQSTLAGAGTYDAIVVEISP